MSETTGYRYPGARPFGDSDLDRKLFFGRDEEINYLFHSILVENLFVLYAKSGMGKTSLLNAGVMERLREKGFFPMTIRLNDPETTPAQSIYGGVAEAVQQRNKTVSKEKRIDYEQGETDSPWQFFKTAVFWSTGDEQLIPVLILDQFEEFFTMHPAEQRQAFISELADLVRGAVPAELRKLYKTKDLPYSETPPQVKLVISMREDYLGHLDELSHMIPTILRSRYRLMPLTRKQARDAIIKPAQLTRDTNVQVEGFSFADETVDEMVGFLSERVERNKTIKTDEVEPFQLQLLCRHVEEKVKKKAGEKTGGLVVQKNDLGGKAGMKKVLQGFYESRIRALGQGWKRTKARKLCETGLIDNNLRMSLEHGYIERKFKVSGELLAALVDSRLLRSEPRVGSFYYELSHDTLVQPILQSRKERKIRRNRVAVPMVLLVLIFVALFASSQLSKKSHIQELYKEAVELKKKGNYSAAVEYYKQILEMEEKDAAPYLELGELRELQNSNWGAIAVYEKAIARGIKSDVIHHRLGHLYAEDKKWEKAAAHYEQAIDLNPERVVYYTELGDVYRRKDDLSAAEKSYKEALARDKQNPRAYHGLLALYIRHDSLDDAMKIYRQGVHNDFIYSIIRDLALDFKKDGRFGDLERLYHIVSHNYSSLLKSTASKKFADLFAQLNEYQSAVEFYEKTLYPGCKDSSIYKGLAMAYINVGDPGKAVEVYQKAVKTEWGNVRIFGDIAVGMKNRNMQRNLDKLYQTAAAVVSEHAAYYEKLGTAFYYLREYDRAAENYQKALTLDNKEEEAYKGLATVQIYLGKPTEALKIFARAVAVDTNFASIYRDIAWIMKQNKAEGELDRLLQTALNIETGRASYYDKLGRDFIEMKKYDHAVTAYQKALSLDTGLSSVYTGLATAYIKNGRPAAVLDVYRQALKANPDFADIYLDIYRDFTKEMTAERVQLLESAFAAGSNEASYYEKLAQGFQGSGKNDRAIAAYQKALSLNEKNASIYAELALLYIDTGTPEKALDLFRRAAKKVHYGLGEALVEISSALWRKKLGAERTRLLETAAGVKTRDSSYYETIGFYFIYTDRERAAKLYEKALKLDDGNMDVYDNLVIIYMADGRTEKVMKLFQKAVKARADYTHCYKKIAAAFKERNMQAELQQLTRAYEEVKKKE